MKPQLEVLESRDALSAGLFGYNITEVPAPPNMTSVFQAQIDTDISLFVGQTPFLQPFFGPGIKYEGQNQIIRYDITPAQWGDLLPGVRESTSRTVLWFFGGDIPVIFAPTNVIPEGNQTYGGMTWEQTSFHKGWWYEDANSNLAQMPNGPQYGQVFNPPGFDAAYMDFWTGYLAFDIYAIANYEWNDSHED